MANTLSSPPELLRRAWRRFSTRWTIAVLISLLMTLVMSIFFMLSSGSILLTGPSLTLTAVISVMLIWSIIALFLGAYSTSMMTVLISEDEKISLGQVFSRANKVYWPILVTSLVVGFMVLGGSVLLVIPGFIMAIYLSLSTIITVNEGKKGLAAARRSRGLLNGQWGQAFWRLFVLGLVVVLVNMIVTGLLRIISVSNPDSVASSLTSLVTSPVIIAYLYEMYLELKKGNDSSIGSGLYNFLIGLGIAASIGGIIFGYYFAREMNSAFSTQWEKALEDAGAINYDGTTSDSWQWNWDYDSNSDYQTNTD